MNSNSTQIKFTAISNAIQIQNLIECEFNTKSNSMWIQFQFNLIQVPIKLNTNSNWIEFNSNSVQIQFKFKLNQFPIELNSNSFKSNLTQIQFNINSI